MRKLLIIFFLLFLTSCSDKNVDTLDTILENTYSNKDSFTFKHSFEFESSFEEENSKKEAFLFEETINYNKSTYTSINTSKTYSNGTEEKSINYETYINYLSNDAYFKRGEDYFNLELSNLSKLGMNSVDPVNLINVLLYENDEHHFVGSDNKLVQNESDYKALVTKISSKNFINLTSSFTEILKVLPDTYEVSATINFNSKFEITSIEFDFNEIIKTYTDYLKQEENKTVIDINASYLIEIVDYNKTSDFNVGNAKELYKDGKLENFTKVNVADYYNDITIASTNSTVTYDLIDSTHTASTFFKLNSSLEYLYFDILYYNEDKLIKASSLDYSNVLENESILLDYFESSEKITDIYIDYYYIEDEYSYLVNKKSQIDFEYKGAVELEDVSKETFTDNTDDFVETLYVYKGINSYNINFDLSSSRVMRNIDYTLFLIDENNKKVFYENDLNLNYNDTFNVNSDITFFPTEAYLYIKYNINSNTTIEQKISLELRDFTKSIFTNYETVNVRAEAEVTSEFDDDFSSTTYNIELTTSEYIDEYIATVFFVKEGLILETATFIPNIENEKNNFSHTIFENTADEIYIDIVYAQGVTQPNETVKVKASLN